MSVFCLCEYYLSPDNMGFSGCGRYNVGEGLRLVCVHMYAWREDVDEGDVP